MAENPQQRVRRHLAAMIEMSPSLVVGDDHFVYKVTADGSRIRFTSPKADNKECFIVHEVLTTLPAGLMLNPYAAPVGPDAPDVAAFYDIMCRSLHSQLSMFLGLINSSLLTDMRNKPIVAQYTQHIEDGGEKAFTEAVNALIKDPSWVSCMYNIHKQAGVVRIVPLYDKDDKDFQRHVKHKKARHAVHAMLQQLFGGHSGGFTGTPFGTIAPAGMTSRANAFLEAYRAFVPNIYDLYNGAFEDAEMSSMLPNIEAFQEAVSSIDEDAPIVRFRKVSVPNNTAPTTTGGLVTGAQSPMQSPNPTLAPAVGFNGNPVVPLNQGMVYGGYYNTPTMVPQPYGQQPVSMAPQPYTPMTMVPQPYGQPYGNGQMPIMPVMGTNITF